MKYNRCLIIKVFLGYLGILSCLHANELSLTKAYLEESSFLKTQGLTEVVDDSNLPIAIRLEEFKKVSAEIATPASLSGYKKSAGSVRFNLAPRHGKAFHPMGSALDYTTGPDDMIYPFNGEFVNTDHDLQLPLRGGVGFSFVRRYSAFDKSDLGLGAGWRHNYDLFLTGKSKDEKLTEVRLHLTTHDVVFTLNNGLWTTQPGDFFELQADGSGIVQVFDSSLTRYDFEPANNTSAEQPRWRLKRIASRHGNWQQNALEFHYLEKSDRIDYANDPFENRIDFYYDGSGRIAAVATPTSFVKYTYSEAGDLVKASYPPRKGLTASSEQEISYDYKHGSWMTGKQSLGLPFKLFVDYDADGKVVATGTRSEKNESTWKFQYTGKATIVFPPFPMPQTNYSFESAIHPSLPTRIEHPALSAVTTIEYNADGLSVKRLSPIGQTDVFEYDSDNPRPIFRCNLLAERSYPAQGYYTDWRERGRETQYHPNVSLPTAKADYQVDKEGQKTYVKRETMSYMDADADYVLSQHDESGKLTRYWFNAYGEPAVVLAANGTATIYQYADTSKGAAYEFLPGTVNGKGFLASKTTTNDAAKIQAAVNDISMETLDFRATGLPTVEQTEFFSYDGFGNVIRNKSPLTDDLAVYNGYADALATFSLGKGCKLTIFTAWGKPARVLHQFDPQDGNTFDGSNPYLFSGRYYTEFFEYDEQAWLRTHYLTDEPAGDGGARKPFIYERYPSGKVKSIASPEGITRIDVRDEATGLIQAQNLVSADSKESVVLASNFEYYPDGILKSMKDRFGGVCTYLIDGYGENYAEVMPNGVMTQVKTNVIGQELSKWSHQDGKILARTDNFYNEQNLLAEVKVFRINGEKNIETTAGLYKYDVVGNVIAKRSVREDAWTYYLNDGLNREIASETPGGDINLTFYGQAVPFYAVSFKRNGETGQLHRIGSYTEFDYCGRKTKSTPVTSIGRMADERSMTYRYDAIGNRIYNASTEQTVVTKVLDTLGNTLVETQTALKGDYNEKTIVTHSYYNQAGQIVRKELENDALALVQEGEAVKPEQKNAPQITRYFYDGLARTIRMIQPDGLVQEYAYNAHSLPEKMRWFYEPAPNDILRDLVVEYSDLAQCLSVMDAKTGRLLRQNEFDLMGNCVKTVDVDNWGKDIVTERVFDSTGTKVSESIKCGDLVFPLQVYEYDLSKGTMEKSWVGLRRTSLKFWEQELYSLDMDGRLSSIGLDKDGLPFASWTYLGAQATRRTILNSSLTTTTTYNDFREPTAQLIKNHITGQVVGKLDYGYGRQGQAEYSAAQLLSESTANDYRFASFSMFDSFRRLVAQNTERILLQENTDWKDRAKQLFDAPSDANLSALQTQRMMYDQANNIWLNYTGGYSLPEQLTDFQRKQNPIFSSSAEPITLNNGAVQDLDLKDLASNRDVSKATYANDGEYFEAETQIYDKLGCLIEYDGTYFNGFNRIRAKWNLTYDPLGRLVTMHAYALADNDNDGIKKDDHLAELQFSYDSENRRIRKTVIDSTPRRNLPMQSTYTIYTGNNQAAVFEIKDGKVTPREQYLWKPGTRELLMAAMPVGFAQGGSRQTIERYYFQQDKSLNVVFTSKYEYGRLTTVSAMSYFGFGENATQADITQIKSSLQSSNGNFAWNRTLDDSTLIGQWYNIPNTPQYLELELSSSDRLSALKIWAADKFPETFGVFVLPKNAPSPSGDLTRWAETAMPYLANIVREGKYGNEKKNLDWETPYNIPLGDKEGNRVIIFWEDSGLNRIDVREFEVVKVPNNPTAISFAGQWLDVETNLYYQINRYRLAGSNKFISPDPLGYFDGNNLYAYAHNNPLEWHDPDGRWAHILAGAGIGVVLGGGMYALNCWMSGEEFRWSEFGISVLAGAASGAIAAALLQFNVNPIFAGAAAGAVGGAIMEGGITYLRTGDLQASLVAAGKGALWGGAAGAFAGGLGVFGGSSSSFLAGMSQSVSVGALTGALFGGTRRGVEVYYATDGDFDAAVTAGSHSMFRGAMMGGLAGAAGYSLARASNAGFHHRRASIENEKVAGNTRQAAGTRNNYVTKVDRQQFNIDKRSFWNEKGLHPQKNGAYVNTKANREFMLNGRAPIGRDGYPVELHHPKGEVVPMNEMSILTQTQHRLGSNYRLNHPFLFD